MQRPVGRLLNPEFTVEPFHRIERNHQTQQLGIVRKRRDLTGNKVGPVSPCTGRRDLTRHHGIPQNQPEIASHHRRSAQFRHAVALRQTHVVEIQKVTRNHRRNRLFRIRIIFEILRRIRPQNPFFHAGDGDIRTNGAPEQIRLGGNRKLQGRLGRDPRHPLDRPDLFQNRRGHLGRLDLEPQKRERLGTQNQTLGRKQLVHMPVDGLAQPESHRPGQRQRENPQGQDPGHRRMLSPVGPQRNRQHPQGKSAMQPLRIVSPTTVSQLRNLQPQN